MDTSDIRISFDENGVCDNRTNYQGHVNPFYRESIENNTFWPIAERIIKEGKGKGVDYILSMGGDSSVIATGILPILGMPVIES